jgi:hypothetical protein
MRTRLSRRRPDRCCASAVAQLEVAGDEVGVKVREHDVRYSAAVFLGERDVLVDIALRIDHRGDVRLLVCYEV